MLYPSYVQVRQNVTIKRVCMYVYMYVYIHVCMQVCMYHWRRVDSGWSFVTPLLKGGN